MNDIYSLNSNQNCSDTNGFNIKGIQTNESEFYNKLLLQLVTFGEVTLDSKFYSEAKVPYAEMNIVFSGSGTICYNNIIYNLEPGHIYFFPRGYERVAANNNNLHKLFFMFLFYYEGNDYFSNETPCVLPFPWSEVILYNRLKDAVDSQNIMLIKSILYDIFGSIKPYLKEIIIKKAELFSEFSKFFEYVKNNLNSDFSLNTAALIFNLNPKIFSNSFKRKMGISPKKYFLSEKILKIKEYLGESDLQITTIAELMGFKDVYYFSKFFKKMTDLSPSEYRKTLVFFV